MKRLLLTGVSGFLGSYLYKLTTKTHSVSGTYRQNNPFGTKSKFYQIDLTQKDKVLSLLDNIRPEVIIHTAANSNLDDCEKNPEQAKQININVPYMFADYADKHGCRLIHLSSDMVFDGRTGMYTETDPLSPLSVYGYTKAFAEKAILDTCPNSVVVRSALIYGDPNPGGGSFTVWLKHRLQSQQQAPLYTDQYRTPILVNNLARAIVELSENEMTGIVHFGGANRINRYEFGKQFCQVMGYSDRYLHPILMKEHQMTAPRPADVSLSIQKACSQLKTEFLDTKEGLMEMKTMLD